MAEEKINKKYEVAQVRKTYLRAYEPWNLEEDKALQESYRSYLANIPRKPYGDFVEKTAGEFKRNDGAIRSRLVKLLGSPLPHEHSASKAVTEETSPTVHAISKDIEISPEFKKALDYMEKTSEHLFVTGRAGTGKSTLLSHFREITKKKIAVVAPTGVAALNVAGQTIHSFFGFGIDVTPKTVRPPQGKRAQVIKNLESLVIDEVSMVRADLLDCVDRALRLSRGKPHIPFGDVQIIFIGDVYQLPPVVTEEAEEIFNGHYPSPYFFDANVMRLIRYNFLELQKVYRQQDEHFIRLLNSVRSGIVTEEELALLNIRYIKKENDEKPEDFSVALTTRTALAESINLEKLRGLKTPLISFRGSLGGNFKEKSLPTAENLQLKVGAQVMLLNNDTRHRWVNGTLGKITKVKEGEEGGELTIQLQNGNSVAVETHTWDMVEHYYDTKAKNIAARSVGSFTQFPVKLAWAVTIHKAQGKTFDRVVIDIGEGTFAHGQMYVALSRCRTLEGISLRKPIEKKHIFIDERVVEFIKKHFA